MNLNMCTLTDEKIHLVIYFLRFLFSVVSLFFSLWFNTVACINFHSICTFPHFVILLGNEINLIGIICQLGCAVWMITILMWGEAIDTDCKFIYI